MPTFLSATNLADLTGTSLATAQKWGESGVYPYHKNEKGKEGFYMEELTDVESVKMMLESTQNLKKSLYSVNVLRLFPSRVDHS